MKKRIVMKIPILEPRCNGTYDMRSSGKENVENEGSLHLRPL